MPLLNQAYNYIKNEPYTKYLICLLIFELIFNTIISYIIVVISNGKFNLIVYYMVLSYIQKMFNPIIIQPIIIKLTISIQSKFYKDYTYQYDKLTYECKNSKMHSQFIENIKDAYHSIESVIDWGLIQSFSLVSAFTSVIITFSKKGLMKHLIIFLIIYSLSYYYIIKKKQEDYSKIQIENRNKRLKNIIGSFLVKNQELIKNRNIILIDDVTTTGATLSEAKKVLKQAGARKIIAFTIAH